MKIKPFAILAAGVVGAFLTQRVVAIGKAANGLQVVPSKLSNFALNNGAATFNVDLNFNNPSNELFAVELKKLTVLGNAYQPLAETLNQTRVNIMPNSTSTLRNLTVNIPIANTIELVKMGLNKQFKIKIEMVVNQMPLTLVTNVFE